MVISKDLSIEKKCRTQINILNYIITNYFFTKTYHSSILILEFNFKILLKFVIHREEKKEQKIILNV